MKKAFVCMALVVLFASSTWAAPVGPGGRIYVTRYGGGNDDELKLLRIDVDGNWDVVDDCGVIANVVNDDALNHNDVKYTCSPEILHRRATQSGAATGGDGSVFLAGYFDTDNHVRYYKVMPDGTPSVLHPGVGGYVYRDLVNTPYTGGDADNVSGGPAFVVDSKGEATGYPDSVIFHEGATSYCNGYWRETDADDDFTTNGVYTLAGGGSATYPGYIFGAVGPDDTEIGGAPFDYDGTDNYIWGMGGYDIKYAAYDATASRWRVGTFYHYHDGGNHKYLFRNNGIAVGDVDNDGRMDVYAVTTDSQGTSHFPGSIFRMTDLTGDGTAHQDADRWDLIYDNNTLPGTANDLGDGGHVDIELIQDPASGDWTLLLLEESGKLWAIELADNGARADSADAIKVILDSGLTESGFDLYGVEFDADVIPEPGTLLLIGTGVLGITGYLRRRRMT